jgi:sulfate adenylyltransferase subunit 1 (EFTu-like GTPase family)
MADASNGSSTSLLRFITCGSVDDGKSTLIGRLLYESKMLYADQVAELEADSRKLGTRGGAMDFALLLDGLAAEREQGITIDVAYRFFGASTSWPTHPATSSTPATWSPARPPQTWPSC